jgi:predicted AAA+ superfamily ATPase
LDTEKAFTLPINMKKIDLFNIDEQKKFIINEVFNSKTRYYLITGENGTGKTTLIQSTVEDLKNQGRKIIYIDVNDSLKFGELFADSINFDFSTKISNWKLFGVLRHLK